MAFNAYAAYYDYFYRDKPYVGEVTWVTEKIRELFPTAHSILDVGCGTGIHAQLFSEHGFDVLGIDSSEQMIKLACAKNVNGVMGNKISGNSPIYKLGDARFYNTKIPVDVITMLFHVMSYQTTEEDLRLTLETANINLVDHGLLIFDVWHKEAVLHQKPEKRSKAICDGPVAIKRIATPTHHKSRNVIDVAYSIHVKNGTQAAEFSETHSMRYFSRNEISLALKEAGFSLIKTCEPVSERAPSKDTWGVCYIAQKDLFR